MGAISKLKALRQRLPSSSPSLNSVVVLGCSHGKGVEVLHECGFDAYGIDVAPAAIDVAKRLRGKTCRLPTCFTQGSLTKLPYTAGSMDAGLSVDVLEHISPDDVPTVVDEISRVVKHYLVLQIATVPEAGRNGEKHGMENLHLTVRSKEWWSQQFARVGWQLFQDGSDHAHARIMLKK